MSNEDWYRNTNWNITIKNAFFEKIKKSRTQKSQYLKIQALYLIDNEPDVALKLISYARENSPDEFLEQELNLYESKILYKKNMFEESLEKAYKSLEWRVKIPGIHTEIIYWICELVLRIKKKPDYIKCFEIMRELHRETPFPIYEYKFHAFSSLIFNEIGEKEKAINEANLALNWALKEKNLLQNEQKIKYGIVNVKKEWPFEELENIISNSD